jgi:hypothetical protein
LRLLIPVRPVERLSFLALLRSFEPSISDTIGWLRFLLTQDFVALSV